MPRLSGIENQMQCFSNTHLFCVGLFALVFKFSYVTDQYVYKNTVKINDQRNKMSKTKIHRV